MPTPQPCAAVSAPPYSDEEIRRRLDACPKLASLESINRALTSLVNSEQSLTSQIADIIRRDPSLSARLLRMVNSVYFGLSANVSSIEEAVFFLGLRQIRELSRATPVIEDLARLQNTTRFEPELWKSLWSHSIGTAILTREILATAPITVDDETDYLVGLLHNLGKIIMAYAFPEELMVVATTRCPNAAAVCALERKLIGWDHAQIGGYYLDRHHLTEEIVFAVRYHHAPDLAPRQQIFAAAVQVADHLVRHSGMAGGFEQVAQAREDDWESLAGWSILYGQDEAESKIARASLANTLRRLPAALTGLV
ncbi:MAG TPA: HDOD domain-containing protein [Opitutaceae bacterium]|jgi:HD-like signal output (HDOD) protein|nr:HDOD domain-containing protein [Opitutaceae bacterium]